MSVGDWVAVGSIAIALASAGVTARNSLKATNNDEDRLEIERAKELRADAAEARSAARLARTDATEALRVADEAHRRANAVVDYLSWVLRLINDPTMDIDTLRRHVRDSVPPVHAGAIPRGD